MKTKSLMIIIFIITLSIIVISGFFISASLTINSNLTHHDEISFPIPDDHFKIHGIKWEWNNYIYDINEEISFTVSRYAKTCGDVFDARLMAPDWSNTIWQESIKSKCEVGYDELIDNDYYHVLVTADFPSQNTIQLAEEGLYVLRIESKDSHTEALGGQLIVKNKTHLEPDLLETANFDNITTMKPNSVEFFYYPGPEKDKDTHQLFMLIRLPEWMGGAENNASAFRAYSAKALDDPCVVKYWPDVGRQRIENPCQGGMYRVIDGALTYGAIHRSTAMTALPYLELSIDKNGMLFVEPPKFTPSENGVIGFGRNLSLDEIRSNSVFLAESFAKYYPKYPLIPTEFAGYILSEITPENHSVTVRYLDFPHKSGHITMTVGLQTSGTTYPNFIASNVESWQIGDTEIRIGGSAMDEDSNTHESFRTYEIKFRDGYYYTIEGKNLEFLKKSIISNFFPEFEYNDLFLVSRTLNE